MPENWKTYKLGDILTLNYGKSLTAKKRIEGNIPVFSSSGRTGWHNQPLVKEEGIIVGRKGTVGSVFKTQGPFYCIDTAYYILRKDSVYHFDFLFYLLHTIGLEKLNFDSAVPGLNRNIAYDQEILLPPLQEQNSIASILSALDDKIELNLQMNKTLEEMAMALYKHWFVDFGPFQDGEFVDSELGEIPKGWEVKRLGEFIQHQKGFAFKSKWYQDSGRMVVRVSDTTENSINIDSCNKIPDKMASDYLRYSLKTNDIILATVGSWPPNFSSVVGKIVRVPPTAENALLNQNAVKLNMVLNGNEQQGLLYTTLKLDRFLNYIVNCAQGSASQASIKLTDIFNFPIPYSVNAEIDNYKTQVDNYLRLQNINILENQTLTQLRDTLLPKLISGEVRVKDVEKTLSEVL